MPKDLRIGVKLQAVVVELIEVDCSIFCQLAAPEYAHALKQLDDDLNQTCSRSTVDSSTERYYMGKYYLDSSYLSPNNSFSVKVGNAFACQFSADNRWYRVAVDLIEDNQCHIRYIDFGNSEVVPMKKLKRLPKKFCDAPPYSFKGLLENASGIL